MARLFILSCALNLLFVGESVAQSMEPMAFTDVSQGSGLAFAVEQASPQTGAGIAVIYWDSDGLPDLLFSGGLDAPMQLFRNEGGLIFTPVSMEESGLSQLLGDPRGVSAADYDNDGDTDFFVANWAKDTASELYRNDGGVFVPVGAEVGVQVPGDATGGAWGDYTGDGFLDLYVGRYWGEQNHLYKNEGNGSFVEVALAAGLDQSELESETLTFHSMWVDVDRDGWVDLLEMNDRCYNGYAHNRLWRNNHDGTFTDQSAAWGLDLCFDAMGIGLNDYDRDGFFDLFLTNVPDGHFLLKGHCGGFSDQTSSAGVESNQWGWGVVFEDLNHDTYPDLFVAHAGYVTFDDGNRLFQGNGGMEFWDVSDFSDVSGGDDNSAVVVRADLDLDGDDDLVVSGIQGAPNKIFRNDSVTQNYLKVRFQGTQSNRDGVGAWVDVYAGALWLRRQRVLSDTFAGTSEPTLLFGLGQATEVDKVVVHWPSGAVQVVEDPQVNTVLLVVEEDTGNWSHPLWVERCGDQRDNDCDGTVDEGFPLGESCQVGLGECAAEGVYVCALDRLGVVCAGTPTLPSVEVSGDGLDNDCDGVVDESPSGDVCSESVELCGDGQDNDCDGVVDEGFATGTPCSPEGCSAVGAWGCSVDGLASVCVVDLNEVAELCGDGQDNDCDGEVDEGFSLGEVCWVGVGACRRKGNIICAENGLDSLCAGTPDLPGLEVMADGLDNDCDGLVDELDLVPSSESEEVDEDGVEGLATSPPKKDSGAGCSTTEPSFPLGFLLLFFGLIWFSRTALIECSNP